MEPAEGTGREEARGRDDEMGEERLLWGCSGRVGGREEGFGLRAVGKRGFKLCGRGVVWKGGERRGEESGTKLICVERQRH